MKKGSYREILKSTTVVGGAQLIKVAIGVAKNKILALIIGPTGIGLIGTFNSAINMLSSLAGMGIGFSGVRQVAEADASGDEDWLSRTVFVLRRVSILLGISGSILCFLLSRLLSRLTFGDASHARDFAWLSVVVFLMVVMGSQNALIQGKRRIKDLAKLTVWGTLISTGISVPMVYFWGMAGIIPFIVLLAGANTIVSWFYARKIEIKKISLTIKEVVKNSTGMIRLGIAFMMGGLLSFVSNYIIRAMIIRTISLKALGFYQASYIMSTVYMGVILNAMGKDFYPRLTSVAKDPKKCTDLINEQTEIGIYIATPAVLLTMTFAPIVIKMFYSGEFIVAVDILRWQIMGVYLQVISFSIAYLSISMGLGRLFFFLQLAFCSFHVALVAGFMHAFGILGTGIAFFTLYLIYLVVLIVVGKRLIDFSWSSAVKRSAFITGVAIFLTLAILAKFKGNKGMALASGISIFTMFYCLRSLMRIMDIERLSQIVDIVKKRIHRKNRCS